MRIVLYLNSISPHQLPFARALVARVGYENLLYVYTSTLSNGRQQMGWSTDFTATGVRLLPSTDSSSQEWLENADILYTGIRCPDLLERRSAHGLISCYYSERWFKPLVLNLKVPLSTYFLHLLSKKTPLFAFDSKLRLKLPGSLRLLVPSYRRMSKRFLRLMNGDPKFITLPVGPWAKNDFLRLGVRADKMLDWGYFVEPSDKTKSKVEVEGLQTSTLPPHLSPSPNSIKVLYIGRLLKLKHVDTIIRAVALANEVKVRGEGEQRMFTLSIMGDGPEKPYLQRLTKHLSSTSTSNFNFLPSVPIDQVRSVIRAHDLLVFSSDAQDGWGAVVSEALTEGVPVIGTYETGASAALLPDAQLFHSGNHKELAFKLLTFNPHLSTIPQDYTPDGAAQRFLEVAMEVAK